MTTYQQAIDIPVNAWIVQTKEEADEIMLRGGKIILMTEETPSYLGSPQFGTSCLKANSLLPDYEAVSYYLDNNLQAFNQIYTATLMNPESTIYFVTIISAITNDIPLGFLFGNEEIEVAATGIFLNFLATCYGIVLGNHYPFMNMPPKNGFMVREYVPKNTTLLYLNNLLTPQEFLFVYPQNTPIDIPALQKLIIELSPPLKNPMDMEEAQNYFNDFRNGIRRANKVLEDPMVMI